MGESKAMSLARLAADERTPEHERTAAALALAKLVVKGGAPATARIVDGGNEASLRDLLRQQNDRIEQLLRERDQAGATLRRENQALAAIAKQLRADKADLEARLKWHRDHEPAAPEPKHVGADSATGRSWSAGTVTINGETLPISGAISFTIK